MATITPLRPQAWTVLEQALTQKRPVALRYHGRDRIVCPHAVGWKNGRLRVLSYQVADSAGTLSSEEPTQRWRCLFLDEIEAPVITDRRWESATNYSPGTANGIDVLVLAVDS
jgi:predicted DNA-binding transcriptional regulator YafY